jgi:hypothetical protein
MWRRFLQASFDLVDGNQLVLLQDRIGQTVSHLQAMVTEVESEKPVNFIAGPDPLPCRALCYGSATIL